MLIVKSLAGYPFSSYQLSGSLDALGVQVFEDGITAQIKDGDYVILEMKALTFLSSAGIRKLISLEKSLRKNDGCLILSGITDQVRQVLDISGLLSLFHISANLEEAVEKASAIANDQHRHKGYSLGDRDYQFTRLENKGSGLIGWKTGLGGGSELLYLSVNELGYGLGSGCFAEDREGAKKCISPFMSLPGFFAFKPAGEFQVTDYIHTGPKGIHGVYVEKFLGTACQPDCMVEISANGGIPEAVMTADLLKMAGEMLRQPPPVLGVVGFVKVQDENGEIECQLCSRWMIDGKIPENVAGMSALQAYFPVMDEGPELYVLRNSMILRGMESLPAENKLEDCLDKTLENESLEFEMLSSSAGKVIEGRLWLFLPISFHPLEEERMSIETEEGEPVPDNWDLIIRSVYPNVSRVKLQPLHGGFSARTFMVTSYDKAGRKRLPTVLKLGNTNIIGREERHYHEHVQPFILNNSVSVLGATYYGSTGGICYNFLGVGGPESKIRWLTDIYRERDAAVLKPLFDRIFLGILQPWYGQTSREKLYLFRDHSPLFPFFPHIIDDAWRVLGIDADKQYLACPYLGRDVLNPYWYLKYEWPRRENESAYCFTSVCHGDLNMQNILIDEKENIYIIDFSETEIKNALSDFARLEPIFKMEMTRMKDEADLAAKLRFEEAMVKMEVIGRQTGFVYEGDDPSVGKAYEMISQVREYARQVCSDETDTLAYWLPVLEWTLPYVSYINVSPLVQWQAAYSAGLICERLYP